MDTPTCMIDGFGPLPLARPGGVAEVGEMIRQAAASGGAIYPMGGQTALGLGMPPTRPGTAIDLRGLAQVIDFPARDMTITVQAGIAMQALSEMLAKENLRLPIDVPRPDRATLGGVIATNSSGARRHGYGTLRDYVIGISALNDEGREFKAGGRVVKNVAGYDLCKLLVGSLGTLGVITQVTLKLRPRAEQQAVILLPCEAAELDSLLAMAHASRTRPVCLELFNRTAAQVVFAAAGLNAPELPWVIVVGYEGNADAVGWQVQEVVKEAGARKRLEAYVDFTALPICHALCDPPALPESPVTFKANLLPSATADFCIEADREPSRPALRAHAGSGIVLGHWADGLTKESAASILTAWRDRALKCQGNVVVTRCPSDWKASLSVWGSPANDAWLMRDVKAKFDPKGIFNPGRFIDGI